MSDEDAMELIDTWWDVNFNTMSQDWSGEEELIDTWWDVNDKSRN